MIQPLVTVTRSVHLWAERSQQGACRNALVASTALNDRRRERLEVAEFLDRELGTDLAELEPAREVPAQRRAGA